MENIERSTKNSFEVGENTIELLANCGVFAQGTIVKLADTAVAKIWLCKQPLLLDNG
jgi:hypothetical protein